MPDKPDTCPKCQGQMQEGFILEFGNGQVRTASRWIADAPDESSFWWGAGGGVKIKGKEQHPVQSYRCTSCGYLESYATGE